MDVTHDFFRQAFFKALRPFSFVVAIINAGLAVALAYQDGLLVAERGVLVVAGCLLLQAGVNLINDLADLRSAGPLGTEHRRAIILNARYGGFCFVLAFAIAVYLIVQVGWPLLLVTVIGLLGALGYTLEPINYKRRGLGVLLVFWLMGMLMVGGGYLAITGGWPVSVWLLSVPVSLLTGLLLLSNEIRDLDIDRNANIYTLAGRLGIGVSRRLFQSLIALSYLCALGLYVMGFLQQIIPVFFSVLLLPWLLGSLATETLHRQLPPRTGAFFMLFGMGYIAAVLDLLPLN